MVAEWLLFLVGRVESDINMNYDPAGKSNFY